MEQDYTQNQIIRYLYKEVNVFEHFEIEDAIEFNPTVRDQYKVIKKSFDQLAGLSMMPSSRSIKNILGYSKSTGLSLA
jgi:hypothetical protein